MGSSYHSVNIHLQRPWMLPKRAELEVSADVYWQAFLSLPDDKFDEARFHVLHRYTSQLLTITSEAIDIDFDNLQTLLDDQSERRLFRMEAGFTLGVLYYGRGKRHKSNDIYEYDHNISIGVKNKKLKTLVKEKNTLMICTTENKEPGKKSMKELIEMTLHERSNYEQRSRGRFQGGNSQF